MEVITDSIVVGVEKVAKHFGVTPRTVYTWMKNGMPRLSQKRFDLLQVQEWLERRKGILRPGPGPGYVDPKQRTLGEVGSDPVGASGKDFQEERYKKARADEAEIRVKKLKAELVERSELTQLFVVRIMAVKQGLLSFARSLPPQLIHCQNEREMEAIILGAVRELLLSFSRPLPENLGGAAVDIDVLPV